MWQSDDEWARELTKQVSVIDDRPNLARVVGYCATRYKKKGHVEPVRFIVEEDACNGNLHDYLHKERHQPLSWAKRLSILRDVARGLAYFHDELDNKVHTYKHIYHSFTNKIFLLHTSSWLMLNYLAFFMDVADTIFQVLQHTLGSVGWELKCQIVRVLDGNTRFFRWPLNGMSTFILNIWYLTFERSFLFECFSHIHLICNLLIGHTIVWYRILHVFIWVMKLLNSLYEAKWHPAAMCGAMVSLSWSS